MVRATRTASLHNRAPAFDEGTLLHHIVNGLDIVGFVRCDAHRSPNMAVGVLTIPRNVLRHLETYDADGDPDREEACEGEGDQCDDEGHFEVDGCVEDMLPGWPK